MVGLFAALLCFEFCDTTLGAFISHKKWGGGRMKPMKTDESFSNRFLPERKLQRRSSISLAKKNIRHIIWLQEHEKKTPWV